MAGEKEMKSIKFWKEFKEKLDDTCTQDIWDRDYKTEALREFLFTKEGTPKCAKCGTPMVNAVDTKTGKISKYIWKTTCGHSGNLRLSLG